MSWKDLGLLPIKELKYSLTLEDAPALLPRAATFEAALLQLKDALFQTPIITMVGEVNIIQEYLPHIVEKRSDARERYANFILPTLERPTEIWGVREGINRNQFIKLFDDNDKEFLISVDITLDNCLYNAIPMPLRSIDNRRMGELLFQCY